MLPMQPIENNDGNPRFRGNTLVIELLEQATKRGYGLNELHRRHSFREKFSPEDWAQFYQLIGYTLNGYAEIDKISDEAYGVAATMAENPEIDQRDARIQWLQGRVKWLEEKMKMVRAGMRAGVAELYELSPDDLPEVED